jgi:hypothetical protein
MVWRSVLPSNSMVGIENGIGSEPDNNEKSKKR